MTPEDMLKKTTAYYKNLLKAEKMSVVVGLPKETASSKVYKDHQSVIQVGASHEYGANGLPRRSFLNMPFNVKKKELAAGIKKQFDNVVATGFDAEKALGRVGLVARNIVLEAFRTQGFGHWPDITQATKDAKKSTKVLIDTGTLRNSITWVVRG